LTLDAASAIAQDAIPPMGRDSMQHGGVRRGTGSLVDVLDRVLDKGIVVEAWVCASLVGISLARAVVASVEAPVDHSRGPDLLRRRIVEEKEHPAGLPGSSRARLSTDAVSRTRSTAGLARARRAPVSR
jgi:hypothetical protein